MSQSLYAQQNLFELHVTKGSCCVANSLLTQAGPLSQNRAANKSSSLPSGQAYGGRSAAMGGQGQGLHLTTLSAKLMLHYATPSYAEVNLTKPASIFLRCGSIALHPRIERIGPASRARHDQIPSHKATGAIACSTPDAVFRGSAYTLALLDLLSAWSKGSNPCTLNPGTVQSAYRLRCVMLPRRARKFANCSRNLNAGNA